MKIIKIEDPEKKSKITQSILNGLKNWFGMEESNQNYIKTVKDKLFLAAFDNDEAVGFISIEKHNAYTADIYVFGVNMNYHKKGIGTLLIKKCESILRQEGFRILMVKTLGPSSPDEYYKKTRLFYERVGFYPLEEYKEIWDENNPCLIMVKTL